MARSVRGSGRPLEAAGNGGPRWMITTRFVRVQDPAYRSALSTSSEQPPSGFFKAKALAAPHGLDPCIQSAAGQAEYWRMKLSFPRLGRP